MLKYMELEKMFKSINLNYAKKTSILTAFAICLFLYKPAFAETLAETATTMEIQQQMMEGAATPATNQATEETTPEQQGASRLDRVAQKLMQSMQSGKYDKADFSSFWDSVVPQGADFSNGLTALCKPVFDQFGKPEKLGKANMISPNKAIFPVQFTNGTVDMTLSIDQADKVVQWTLAPAVPQIAAATEKPPSPATPEQQPAKLAGELPQDTNPGSPVWDASRRDAAHNVQDINDFNAFKQEINRIDFEARGEENQWLGRLERKAELARAMDDVVVAELRFLKKLAETEKSQKTVDAIAGPARQAHSPARR
jgi:hypothetical protein